MKTFCCLAIALIVSLPALIAAGPDSSGKEEPKRELPLWGQPVEGLRLSLRSAQTKYAVGDKVEVQMVIQNVDTKNRDVVDTDPRLIFEFEVKGPDGKALPLNKRGKEIQENPRVFEKMTLRLLKPKEETAFSLELSEFYDLQNPGEYQATASIAVQQQKDTKKWSKLSSNPLTITITEAKEKKDK